MNRTWAEVTHWIIGQEGLLQNLGKTSEILVLPMVTPLPFDIRPSFVIQLDYLMII